MKKFILPQAVLDVVKFTVTPASGRVVTLDGFTAPCSGMVDWGDGTASPLTSTAALSHTYADVTARQIAIRGTLGGFWNTTGSTGKNLVTSLDEISSRSLITLQNAFRGCTALRDLPAALDAPNVVNFNYTFYQNRSIISNLTPLWLTHAAKPHSGCFTDCCKSLYGQHGGGCPHRQYVSAVPGLTYFQKYGQSGCPAAKYVPGTAGQTYFQRYNGCNSCPKNGPKVPYTVTYAGHKPSCHLYNQVMHYTWSGLCTLGQGITSTASYPPKTAPCDVTGAPCGATACTTTHTPSTFRYTSNGSTCTAVYSYASSAYYSCSHFGGTCKTSGCTRIYQSGQSAYYRCTRSGGTCQATSCQYPYANETSYNNARSNGWA